MALGDDFFVTKVLQETESELIQKPDLCMVIAAIERIYGRTAESLLKTRSRDRLSCEVRTLAAWATLELSGATLTSLAALCQRDVATISYAATQAEKLRVKDPAVSAKMLQLREELTTAHGSQAAETF
jgi:chromosomal replication initiation ATPase DnaA